VSALTNLDWESDGSTASANASSLSVPDALEVSGMRDRAIAFRDTMIVVVIQLVFRATLAMRRWNY
jgi:hypothetical protein